VLDPSAFKAYDVRAIYPSQLDEQGAYAIGRAFAEQFEPRRMSVDEMQRGYYQILEALFAPGAMFARSRALLERLEPHIFHGSNARASDVRAAIHSLWRQGVLRGSRVDYFRLLLAGHRRDVARLREARRAIADLERRMRSVAAASPTKLTEVSDLSTLVDRAREAMVRAEPARRLDEISAWARDVQTRVDGAVDAGELQSVYSWSREYFLMERRLHRFPGAYLVKAFNLAIKGLHYETVMHGLASERAATHDRDTGGAVPTLSTVRGR